MQLNTAKQKLLAGQPAYGYSLGLGSPLVAELLARSGIDFLLLETQHGSWGHDGAIAALMGITGGSAIPMTRVAKNEYFLIGKLLDQGCWGWWCRWSIRRSRPRPRGRLRLRAGEPLLGRGAGPGLRGRLRGLDRRAALRRRAAGERHGGGQRRGDHGHPRRRRLLGRPGRPGPLHGHPPPGHGRRRAPRQGPGADRDRLPQHGQGPQAGLQLPEDARSARSRASATSPPGATPGS